jgi:hypothetical protein
MSPKSLRAKVVAEARRDAVAYCREFQKPVGPEGTDWVTEAWADLRQFLKLKADQADRLWPMYWKTLSEETARIARVTGLGE